MAKLWRQPSIHPLPSSGQEGKFGSEVRSPGQLGPPLCPEPRSGWGRGEGYLQKSRSPGSWVTRGTKQTLGTPNQYLNPTWTTDFSPPLGSLLSKSLSTLNLLHNVGKLPESSWD